MFQEMKRLGIEDAILVSGHRDYAYQAALFREELKKAMLTGLDYAQAYKKISESVAFPGESEHQTGLAFDIASSLSGTTGSFEWSPAGRWLGAHAADYGFVLRYPEEKTDFTGIMYEPWHFRFVGWPHAEILQDHGWVIEEYLALLQKSHYLDAELRDGTTVRVMMRPSLSQLPEGAVDVSADNAGSWIVTYVQGKNDMSVRTAMIENKNTLWSDQIMAAQSRLSGSEDPDRMERLKKLLSNEVKIKEPAGLRLENKRMMVFLKPDQRKIKLNGQGAELKMSVIRILGVVKGPIAFELESKTTEN
jgi:hypothetical protein